MAAATVTSKGQITIPKEVRDFLRANAGDRLEFTIEESGAVRIRKVGRSIKELAGMLHRPGMKPVTLEEMHESLLEAVAEDDERILRSYKR